MASINFLELILATMQSLSRTVGNVEFPMAASSGRHASLYNKSNASLWLTSTKQFRISLRKSSSTSEYTVLNEGVNRPVVVYLLHPTPGIEDAPNCPDYHMSLEASAQTSDKT